MMLKYHHLVSIAVLKKASSLLLLTGEGSCKFCDFDCDKELKAKIKGNLRIFDALTTGLLGKVK